MERAYCYDECQCVYIFDATSDCTFAECLLVQEWSRMATLISWFRSTCIVDVRISSSLTCIKMYYIDGYMIYIYNVICFCISYMHIYIIIYTTYLRFFRSCFSGYCWFYTSIPTYLCFHKNRGNTDPDPSGSATATPGWGDGSVWLVEFR